MSEELRYIGCMGPPRKQGTPTVSLSSHAVIFDPKEVAGPYL